MRDKVVPLHHLAAGQPVVRVGGRVDKTEVSLALDGPDEATTQLLDMLPNDERIWQELSERFDLYVSCDIFFRGWNKGFSLPRALHQRLAGYRAELTFDLYAEDFYPEDFFTSDN